MAETGQASGQDGKAAASVPATAASEMQACEENLLHRDFSSNPAVLENYLCNDFEEISSSGHVSSRQAVINWLLQKDPASRWQLDDLSVTQLASGLRLVRYRARQILPQPSRGQGAHHSSLWRFNPALQCWQMRFHQASKIV